MAELPWLAPSITAAAALVGALIGGLITAGIARNRLRFDMTQAARQQQRQRREDARPSVGRLADLFTKLAGRAAPRWEAPDQPAFEDVFADWWPEFARKLRRGVLEVPDPEARGRLSAAIDSAELSWAIDRYGLPEDQRRIVELSAEVGAEVAGAWLREDAVEPRMLQHLERLSRAVDDWETDQREAQEAAEELRRESD